MRRIELKAALSEEETAALAATLLGPDSYDLLVEEDAEVVDAETGALVLKFVKKELSAIVVQRAYENLLEAAVPTQNRGYAAGPIDESGDVRKRAARADGTLSNTNIAKDVQSGIVGFFDRAPRFPYCRQTAFTMKHMDRFQAAMPLFVEVGKAFERHIPDRYAAQMEYVNRTEPEFVIAGTPFTTVTVNRNWQTAVHQDAGDLKAGFGVMTAIRAGTFEGCYFCLPKYRVAVDMRTRDVLFANVHEWHGNTPIRGFPGRFTRLSMVLYYREKMHECGSPLEELERAKAREAERHLEGK